LVARGTILAPHPQSLSLARHQAEATLQCMNDVEPVLRRADREQFATRDGSLVTELVHPSLGGSTRQSLAEAVVPAGGETIAHRHHRAEEIYSFVSGHGRMTLGENTFDVTPGDSVVIPPGTSHKLRNAGTEPLVLLCVCAPPYSHEDTELLG
jgi:mannose-6-phosphate isomerase-like protein (cupin superfamily)